MTKPKRPQGHRMLISTVLSCANWIQISIVQGMHCYNCAKRNGYPFWGQPDHYCANYCRKVEYE